jgi:hypothetical protein
LQTLLQTEPITNAAAAAASDTGPRGAVRYRLDEEKKV